jgi:EAL domain-containing protein (putative c-di-GMP-specific phosphodiesterase class I)
MMSRVALRDLLENDRLQYRFQPIFAIGNGRRRPWAAEALVHGPGGTNFETAGVLFDYVRLKHEEISTDHHCISGALKHAAALPSDLRISLNVHAVTIEKDEDFANFIAREAELNGIDPRRIIMEIVEQSRYWRVAWVKRGVARLREKGMSLALDDIGCGHCNYQMIVDLEPEYLKLDRYFVQGCEQEPGRRAVLRSVHQLAGDVGAKVIAEGVETRNELETIRAIGIPLAQGFGLAPPVPVHELAAAEQQEVCV